MAITYREAGVDIDAGDDLVERIKPFAKATRIAEVLSDVGGFAGLCRVPGDVDEPVLVSGTDGVGTKLKVAFATGVHDTIGFDLVGMCVNDVVTCGARPLFFLDYFATGKLDVAVGERVIKGIAAACKESGCALLGGETAELPGMYADGEYDLAGFSVGVVARKKIVDGTRVVAGDAVIGLPSSGLHSNGYSLARRIAFTHAGLTPETHVPELGRTVAEEFLAPTRIYVRAVKSVYRHYRVKRIIHGIAHITGGGLIENPPRILPEGTAIKLTKSWDVPPVFPWLQALGGVPDAEMFRVFNMGIGLVMIVAEYYAESIVRTIRQEAKVPAWVIGEVVAGDKTVEWA